MKLKYFMPSLAVPIFLSMVLICTQTPFSQERLQFNLSEVSSLEYVYSVLILGGGIAGLNAAHAIARAGYQPLLIEGPLPGGLITKSNSVQNWPGEIEISGSELAKKLKTQVEHSNTDIVQETATYVNLTTWPFTVTTQSLTDPSKKTVHQALSIIITMGATPHYLGVQGEHEYWGRGISNCVTCDGFLYTNKVVGIVGGGDAAMTEAYELSRYAKKVYIFVRSKELRAQDKIKNEVLTKDNIEFLFETQVTEIIGDTEGVTGVRIIHKDTPAQIISLDGLFLAIGSTPNSKLFKNQLELYGPGYITLKEHQQTSCKGVFAAGDISDPIFRQADTAVGRAKEAALQALDFLKHLNYDSYIKQKDINEN